MNKQHGSKPFSKMPGPKQAVELEKMYLVSNRKLKFYILGSPIFS